MQRIQPPARVAQGSGANRNAEKFLVLFAPKKYISVTIVTGITVFLAGKTKGAAFVIHTNFAPFESLFYL